MWVPVFSSDLGEEAVGSGETPGVSEDPGPSSATRGGTPSTRSAGVGFHVCHTSGPAALGFFLILQRSLGLSKIGRSQKCDISGSPADSVVKNLPGEQLLQRPRVLVVGDEGQLREGSS